MTDNMKTYKRIVSLGLIVLMCCALFAGCGGKAEPSPAPAEGPKPTEAPAPEPTEKTPAVNAYGLADGVYSAKFDTDSSMFHVNEACEGRGTLTVKNGEMTIHISLASKKITKLFCGKAEDAQKEGAAVLEPTTDTVTYKDGTSDEVYGFDVPVPALGEEFDCALMGTKGTWYDHLVSVSDPQPAE